MEKYLPDAFLFAILLTFISFILALIFTGKGVLDIVNAWGKGLWNLLGFSMQVALILVTGHCLASAPAIKRILNAIADLAKTPFNAVVIVGLVAGICSWLQWGFGLIIGGLLALEMAKRIKNIDYPLLIAAAYGGFVVWHMGLSGSIPLAVASAGNAANWVEKIANIVLPLGKTVFAPWNIIPAFIIILTTPFLLALSSPSAEKAKVLDPAVIMQLQKEEEEEEKKKRELKPSTFAEKVENSIIINYLFSLLGVVFLVFYFIKKGQLDLNTVIAIFLFLGLILHKTPINYVRAVEKAIKGAGGIVLQFPLYAGIQGIMIGTGLASIIAGWFVAISTKVTFYLWQFLAAGIINMFIPSGGGQWAAQGSISIMAAQKMGLDYAKTSMAVAFGDQWTNMIQPFWALPLLGLAKLRAKDIMGYTTIVLLYSGIILAITSIIMAL
ncbi:MAG: short-chain fatty acid transporter [Exilispira sp.]